MSERSRLQEAAPRPDKVTNSVPTGSDIPNFTQLVLGTRPGKLAIAIGTQPYYDEKGKYTHRSWSEKVFVWPTSVRPILDAIRTAQETGDVYVCPAVRHSGAKSRRKGDALPPQVCWADLDGETTDRALLDTLNPLTINSGQPGHAHIYVPLSRPIPLRDHAPLNKALAARLGGDAKWSDESLLRWPTSLNHKPGTTPNTGDPAEVTIEPGKPTIWDPNELAAMLGVDLERGKDSHVSSPAGETTSAEPVDVDTLPEWLQKRFREAPSEPGTRSEAFHGLVGACKDAGLTQGQTVTVMGTWRPGVDKYGPRLAEQVAASWPKLADRRFVAQPRKEPVEPVKGDPEADLANGRLLAATYGDELRYCVPWKKWLIWDGARWKLDNTGEAVRYAKAVADTLPKTAKGGNPSRTQTSAGINAMMAMAGTEPGIAVSQEQLDTDPYLLNVINGTLDLRTGQLRPHNRDDLLTKVCDTEYRPDAQAPEFTAFLERVQPEADMRDFLARLFGHALLGKTVEHLLPVFYGIGANGKTTLVEAVAATFGDYADTVEPGLLIDRGEVHPTGVADLFGLRLAVTHETDEGRRLAEGTVKRLTGGDRVKARRMREDFWTFDPSHSIVMHTNHKPLVRGTDEGIWRRLRFVPFAVVIPEDERDGKLPERLAQEREGILAWMVRGYRQWQDRGLADPKAVTDATQAFRGESDMLATFLDERCMQNPHAHVRSSELFGAWLEWCKRENVEAGTQTAFSLKMTEKGFDKDHTRGGKVWRGIGLYADETTDGDGL